MINKQRGFSLALILILVAGIAGGGFYLYTNSDDYIARHGKTVNVGGVEVKGVGQQSSLESKTEGTITASENAWFQYSAVGWNLKFSFPSQWKLSERVYNEVATGRTGTASVSVEGEGYHVSFYERWEKDMLMGINVKTYEGIVGGYKAYFWEEEENGTIHQAISVPACNSLVIMTSGSSISREAVTKILASVKCEE